MELWQALRAYRRVLRTPVERDVTGALQRLEAQVLLALAQADRLSTERTVLCSALRCVRGRAARARRLLEKSRLLRSAAPGLTPRDLERALAHLGEQAARHGEPELQRAMNQLLGEQEHLARRVDEVTGRLRRVLAEAERAVAQLACAIEGCRSRRA